MFKLILSVGTIIVLLAVSYICFGILTTNSKPSMTYTLSSNEPISTVDETIPASEAKQAPQLKQGDWINSEALSLDKLKGRVVVVDFWTFGCYNCRNTLPALKKFDENYREQGLTIIGVHTPEFDHEKNVKNVQSNVNKLGVKYPVLTDNNSETWNAYSVNAWPSIFILDKQGRIRYTHVGEGRYDVQERVIKALLAEKN